MLNCIVPAKSVQSNLFIPQEENKQSLLMNALDNTNFSMRDDIIKFEAAGTKTDWKMRREFRSPRYTSRSRELREVN